MSWKLNKNSVKMLLFYNEYSLVCLHLVSQQVHDNSIWHVFFLNLSYIKKMATKFNCLNLFKIVLSNTVTWLVKFSGNEFWDTNNTTNNSSLYSTTSTASFMGKSRYFIIIIKQQKCYIYTDGRVAIKSIYVIKKYEVFCFKYLIFCLFQTVIPTYNFIFKKFKN